MVKNTFIRFKRYLSKHNPFISKIYVHISKNYFLNIRKLSIEQLKPNLIVIGAQKSGTTSLHKYLNLHPDVFMSNPLKEPGLFLDFKFIQNYLGSINLNVKSENDLLKNYMLQGYKGQRFIGESSTYYTLGKRAQIFEVPAKIKQTNPKTKFIYIIRNPLDRIVSNYLHEKKRELTQLDLNRHVMNENPVLSDNNALSTSLYFSQISYYLTYFKKEQFKIILFENLIKDPFIELNKIFSFLSLPRLKEKPRFKIYNKSRSRETHSKPELLFTEKVYEYLMDFISEDISKLQKLSGLNLDVWDLSKGKWCLD